MHSNMIYALTWYVHYSIVNGDTHPSVLSRMADCFEHHYRTRVGGGYDITVHFFKSALQEGAFMLNNSYKMIDCINNGIIHVTRKNMDMAAESLMPKFMECICLDQSIDFPPDDLFRGSWTVTKLITSNNGLIEHVAGIIPTAIVLREECM